MEAPSPYPICPVHTSCLKTSNWGGMLEKKPEAKCNKSHESIGHGEI